MTRAFTPPDTLSKDEIRTIADVRREIWTGGFTGLATGSVVGFFGHSVAQWCHHRGWLRLATGKAPYNRSTLLFAVLAGGSLGSFLGASTAGQNNVHLLHPIYQVGKVETKPSSSSSSSSYTSALRRAQEREESIRHLEQRRLIRRETERDLEMAAAAAATAAKRSVQ